ncbi:tripartite motif-containing protein 5-like [Protopterus annectens]|uniref:tripartite motif-containing protein 5-like n=1 Tax=Protopterus annectens TaxID=7888 RepID=UPI001CFA7E6D|nr:tripartite motif-containing protein 5-like [Protopterus annectens]
MQNLCATSRRTKQCCAEHRRRLELFCQEDETFICVLCVPRHSTHSFMFLHESVSVYEEKLKTALSSLQLKVNDLKDLKNKNEKEFLDIHEHACSLEQYIIVQFSKLHQFLHDKEQQLIRQLKNEEAKILKDMKENLKYIKSNATETRFVVSDTILQLMKEEAETLKETEENSEDSNSYTVATREPISDDKLKLRKERETNDFLTAPETFEDVAVTFSEEEWKMLRKEDKQLHREVMVENYESLVSMGMAEQNKPVFRKCAECGHKLSPADGPTLCMVRLGVTHLSTDCSICTGFNPQALKDRRVKLVRKGLLSALGVAVPATTAVTVVTASASFISSSSQARTHPPALRPVEEEILRKDRDKARKRSLDQSGPLGLPQKLQAVSRLSTPWLRLPSFSPEETRPSSRVSVHRPSRSASVASLSCSTRNLSEAEMDKMMRRFIRTQIQMGVFPASFLSGVGSSLPFFIPITPSPIQPPVSEFSDLRSLSQGAATDGTL